MLRRSALRLTTSFVVVLSLLFAQLALANYVCPTVEAGQDEPMTMDMAPGQPCESMGAGMVKDQDQPVLCHQHCVNAPQSFDPVQVPSVSLPAVVHVHIVPLLLDTDSREPGFYAEVGRARPPPDPLFLSTLRLRV
ncbi:hypothetical protein UC35_19285 [Ramlibacter tataouinensis]|uniref:Uncharacterized protein n=2 Tax=Ramlibacter tataouinensis TaxID=94132 RepID=A0A127K046_9BURK|nr:hypothetical protein UC35_19285 [Ramlibacter tataouinensis]